MRSERLNKVTKFARILNLRFLDYLPFTCEIPGQDHFWALIFIYEPIFIFVALFTTFAMQKDDNIIFVFLVCLFGLRLNVPVNTFSVMSGRSPRFLGITSTFWEVNVSCSRLQHGDPSDNITFVCGCLKTR